jgi:hypothetical protein
MFWGHTVDQDSAPQVWWLILAKSLDGCIAQWQSGGLQIFRLTVQLRLRPLFRDTSSSGEHHSGFLVMYES